MILRPSRCQRMLKFGISESRICKAGSCLLETWHRRLILIWAVSFWKGCFIRHVKSNKITDTRWSRRYCVGLMIVSKTNILVWKKLQWCVWQLSRDCRDNDHVVSIKCRAICCQLPTIQYPQRDKWISARLFAARIGFVPRCFWGGKYSLEDC